MYVSSLARYSAHLARKSRGISRREFPKQRRASFLGGLEGISLHYRGVSLAGGVEGAGGPLLSSRKGMKVI